MKDKQSIDSKLNQRVPRALGWGIMGSVLIIAFTLSVVCACVAAKNHEGVVAMITIGSIMLCGLVCATVYCVLKAARAAKPAETCDVAIEPADEPSVDAADVISSNVEESLVQEVSDAVIPNDDAVMLSEVEASLVQESSDAEPAVAAADVISSNVEESLVQEAADAVTPNAVEGSLVQEASESRIVADEPPVVVPAKPAITFAEARSSMSDEEALARVERGARRPIDGPMCTVYVGVLSTAFEDGDTVTLEALQAKGLIPRRQNGYIVLAKGTINKSLTVVANDFSADAVKMILAADGKAIGC